MSRMGKKKNIVTIVDGKNYILLGDVKYQGKLYRKAVETDNKGFKFLRYTFFECIVNGSGEHLLEVKNEALQKTLNEVDCDNFVQQLRAYRKRYIIGSVIMGLLVLISLAFYLFSPSTSLLIILISSIVCFICGIENIYSNEKVLKRVLYDQEYDAIKYW